MKAQALSNVMTKVLEAKEKTMGVFLMATSPSLLNPCNKHSLGSPDMSSDFSSTSSNLRINKY